jgi:hypothetical protein
MRWVVRLVETDGGSEARCSDVMEIVRPDDLGEIANLGLTLSEAKRLQACVQREIVAARAISHGTQRPNCRSCGGACHRKDYREHRIATLFGQVTVRLPRFRCMACSATEAGANWPLNCPVHPVNFEKVDEDRCVRHHNCGFILNLCCGCTRRSNIRPRSGGILRLRGGVKPSHF